MRPFDPLDGASFHVGAILTENEVTYFDAGTRTDTISMPDADYERLGQPVIAEFAERS